MAARLLRCCKNIKATDLRLFCNKSFCFNMDIKVNHDLTHQEFYIDLGEEKAILQYNIEDGGLIDLHHTGVPLSDRGKGLAGLLVKEAFSFAIEKDLQILPTCTYVQHYINKNPSHNISKRLRK